MAVLAVLDFFAAVAVLRPRVEVLAVLADVAFVEPDFLWPRALVFAAVERFAAVDFVAVLVVRFADRLVSDDLGVATVSSFFEAALLAALALVALADSPSSSGDFLTSSLSRSDNPFLVAINFPNLS